MAVSVEVFAKMPHFAGIMFYVGGLALNRQTKRWKNEKKIIRKIKSVFSQDKAGQGKTRGEKTRQDKTPSGLPFFTKHFKSFS